MKTIEQNKDKAYKAMSKEELKALTIEELQERRRFLLNVRRRDFSFLPTIYDIYREGKEDGIDYRGIDEALNNSSNAKRQLTRLKNQGYTLDGSSYCECFYREQVLDDESRKRFKKVSKEAQDKLEEKIDQHHKDARVVYVEEYLVNSILEIKNRPKDLKLKIEENTKALETIDEDLIKAIEKLKEDKNEEEARLKEEIEKAKKALEVDPNTLIDEIDESDWDKY